MALPAALITALLPVLISFGSKAVRAAISEGVRAAYQAALNSVNPWDNILVKGLAILLVVSLDGIEKTNPNAVDPIPAIEDPIISGFNEVFGRPFDPTLDTGA